MNKRVILSICGLLFLSTVGMSQTKNVDIDNVYIEYTYRTFPVFPQTPRYYCYAVNVNTSAVAEQNIPAESIQDSIRIEGEQYVDNPHDAKLVLTVSVGDIYIKSSNVVQETSEGKPVGFFHTEIVYSPEASYTVKEDTTTLMHRDLYRHEVAYKLSSKSYTTRKAVADWWENNREVIKSGLYRKLRHDFTQEVTYRASQEFGFPTEKQFIEPFGGVSGLLKTTDEKKHKENAAFRDNTERLKKAISYVTENLPLDYVDIAPIVHYYDSIPMKYTDEKLKADIHLRYAAWFNLCQIYYILDQPEKVQKYALLLVQNAYKEKDGDRFIALAQKKAKELKRLGIPTTHFDPPTYFNGTSKSELY
ncbi:MAG: hypothetical protein LBN24_09290 [Mediterranea sp.]|jgi:hypothetical protein|nr:hypothetical protein [Mediterranea sp.]